MSTVLCCYSLKLDILPPSHPFLTTVQLSSMKVRLSHILSAHCRVWQFSTRSWVHKSQNLRCRCAKQLPLTKCASKVTADTKVTNYIQRFEGILKCKILEQEDPRCAQFLVFKNLGCDIAILCSLDYRKRQREPQFSFYKSYDCCDFYNCLIRLAISPDSPSVF